MAIPIWFLTLKSSWDGESLDFDGGSVGGCGGH